MSEEIQMDTPNNLQSGGLKDSPEPKSEVKGFSLVESIAEYNFSNLKVKDFLKEYKYEILLGLIVLGAIIYKLWDNPYLLNTVLRDPSEKIDLVYTWVDGSDKTWLEKKNKYSGNRKQIDDNTRFTSIDELKYSLRGVYEYAPWINNIYIVVDDDQKPEWLNLNNPKIHLIKHSQIFMNKEDLPTFNSHAIESNLHNIPGLSENFIYLNDDMFFGNHTKKEDFISEEGKLSYYPDAKKCLYDTTKIPDFEAYYHAWTKTQFLLHKKLNIEPLCQWHFALVLKKSHFTEIKNIFPDEFKNISRSKFRNKNDIVPNGIAYQYGLNKGDYEIKQPLTATLVDARYDPNYINNGLKSISYSKPKMFCINNITKYNPNIVQFLNLYYPNKSPYEI